MYSEVVFKANNKASMLTYKLMIAMYAVLVSSVISLPPYFKLVENLQLTTWWVDIFGRNLLSL